MVVAVVATDPSSDGTGSRMFGLDTVDGAGATVGTWPAVSTLAADVFGASDHPIAIIKPAAAVALSATAAAREPAAACGRRGRTARRAPLDPAMGGLSVVIV
jgi:hypothetical protein